MKSNLNLSIEITHEEDIPTSQDLAMAVAKAIAVEAGITSQTSFHFGRVTLIGAEDEAAVRVFLQSAAISSNGGAAVR